MSALMSCSCCLSGTHCQGRERPSKEFLQSRTFPAQLNHWFASLRPGRPVYLPVSLSRHRLSVPCSGPWLLWATMSRLLLCSGLEWSVPEARIPNQMGWTPKTVYNLLPPTNISEQVLTENPLAALHVPRRTARCQQVLHPKLTCLLPPRLTPSQTQNSRWGKCP